MILANFSMKLLSNMENILLNDLLIFNDYHPSSRVWIFPSNRTLSKNEMSYLNEELNKFLENWKTHGEAMRSNAVWLFDQFWIVVADESYLAPSGCSTDALTRFVRALGESVKLDLLNYANVPYRLSNGKILSLPFGEMRKAVKEKKLDSGTHIFQCSIQKLELLPTSFLVLPEDSFFASKA